MIAPARGCVIVRPVSTEEHPQGSAIILLEDTREKLASHQMLVVSVGEPEICEDPENCGIAHRQAPRDDIALFFPKSSLLDGIISLSEKLHPTDERIKPDAWILVRHRSLVPISDTEKLYTVKMSDIVGVFTEEPNTVAK